MSYKDPIKQKEAQRQSYLRHKDRYRKRSAYFKRKLIQEYIEYKKKLKCRFCNESYFKCLDFHHLDPKTKIFCISKAASSGHKGWGTILKEIDKCIVVCKNCHTKIHDGVLNIKERL